jgi:hypothetical protein
MLTSRSAFQSHGKSRSISWALVRPETIRSSASVSRARGSILLSNEAISKTLGYCWRNHHKVKSSDYMYIMIEKSRTKALFLSRMTPLGEQIFPQGLCSVDFANSIRSFSRVNKVAVRQ